MPRLDVDTVFALIEYDFTAEEIKEMQHPAWRLVCRQNFLIHEYVMSMVERIWAYRVRFGPKDFAEYYALLGTDGLALLDQILDAIKSAQAESAGDANVKCIAGKNSLEFFFSNYREMLPTELIQAVQVQAKNPNFSASYREIRKKFNHEETLQIMQASFPLSELADAMQALIGFIEILRVDKVIPGQLRRYTKLRSGGCSEEEAIEVLSKEAEEHIYEQARRVTSHEKALVLAANPATLNFIRLFSSEAKWSTISVSGAQLAQVLALPDELRQILIEIFDSRPAIELTLS